MRMAMVVALAAFLTAAIACQPGPQGHPVRQARLDRPVHLARKDNRALLAPPDPLGLPDPLGR